MAHLSARFELRMAPDIKGEVEEAAALMGVSLTTFATEAMIERARRIKNEHTQAVLNDRERDAFLKMLSEPPRSNMALRELMKTQVVL